MWGKAGTPSVMILVVMSLSIYLSAYSIPLSEMRPIHLYIKSQVQEGDEIIITLGRLTDHANDDLPKEFTISAEISDSSVQAEEKTAVQTAVENRGKSVQTGEQKTEGVIDAPNTQASESGPSKSTEMPSTELPANTSTSPPPPPPVSSTYDTTTAATSTDKGIVGPKPAGEPGVDEFLVNPPKILCSDGFRHDGNGNCRQVISSLISLGKSMPSSANFLPDDKLRNYAVKFWKTLIMG